jgi:Luciferase-like monooxygenase
MPRSLGRHEAHRPSLVRTLVTRRASRTQTAADALLQTVELARAAEALGVEGAFARVHQFARQLAAPFPLLAAIAARTSRIEIGTGVINIRYENPLYMAEEAAAADIGNGLHQAGRKLSPRALRASPQLPCVGRQPDGRRFRR